MDVKELTRSLAESRKALAAFSAACGALASALVTYKVTMEKLEKQYAARADAEISEAKEHYQKLYKGDGYQTPAMTVETLVGKMDEDPELDEAVQALTNYQGRFKETQEAPAGMTEVVHNVFTDTVVRDLDMNEEMKKRDPDEPYLITEEEFLEAGPQHDQMSITYYQGDDVLADDKDSEIQNVDFVVGRENLKRFGEGSGDPNIVFVRNMKMSTDFEIALSKGKFSVDVLGLDEDDALQHSYQPMRRRRHQDDDD